MTNLNSILTKQFRRLFLFALFISFSHFRAQNIEYKQFTTAQGLLSDKVYNLFQDKSGYLWLFSEFGTLKYDGESFKKVLTNLPLSEAFIYSIYQREDGRIWVANANAHIYEIVNDTAIQLKGFEETSVAMRKSVAEIIKLVVTDNGQVYLSTKHYSYLLKPKGNKYEAENLTIKIENDSVKVHIYELKSDLLPVQGRKENDEFFSGGGLRQRYLSFDKSDRMVKVQYQSYAVPFRHFKKYGNNIYYTKSEKLGKINPNNKVSEITFNSPVLNFNRDHSGHLWVGCLNGGLFELDERDSIVGKYLEGITVNDIAVDFQNGIWASTAGAGLYRFNNNTIEEFRRITKGTSIVFANVSNEHLIIANSKGELYDVCGKQVNLLQKNGAQTVVTGVWSKDKLYVAHPYSLERLSFHSDMVKADEYIMKAPKFFKLYAISDDTLLGVWRRGITVISSKKILKYLDFGEKLTCTAYEKDTLWYGTEGGLYYRKISKAKMAKYINFEVIADREAPLAKREFKNFAGKNISALHIDSKGWKWFAVKGESLYLSVGAKIIKLQTPEVEIINSIDFLGKQILLCTNRGAYLTTLVASPQLIGNWIKVDDREIQSAFSLNNRTYLYSSGTLSKLLDDAKGKVSPNIIFSINGVLADNDFIEKTDYYKLPHRAKNFKFVFKRISYAGNLPNLHFDLIGKVNETGISKSSEIELSRLPTGNYTLSVFPLLLNGEQKKISIQFEVVPEWYETWPAISIAILLGFTIISLAVLFFVNRNRKKIQIHNEQEQLLLEYKLIALKAQVNPHFISNCLTAIQNLIAKGESEKANQYVAKFGLLVRKILDYSSKSLITLNEELQIVELYILMEEVRFGRKFDFEVIIGEEVDPLDCMVPSLLLNPIIENAIWHGILPMSSEHKAQLQVRVHQRDNLLTLSICDNGVGLLKKNVSDSTHKSYGLDITQQRIKNINFLLKSDLGKVEIKNRVNTDGSLAGVEVTVCLPLEHKF